jgi:hypothetical protein
LPMIATSRTATRRQVPAIRPLHPPSPTRQSPGGTAIYVEHLAVEEGEALPALAELLATTLQPAQLGALQTPVTV